MGPGQRSSSRSADGSSGGRASTKYIDIDMGGDDDDDMISLGKGESKRSSDGYQQAAEKGQTWGVAEELHVNLQIEVGDRKFYLHKFPLLSKSGKLNRLAFESRAGTEKDSRGTIVVLSDIPGGAHAFELIAQRFYGGKLELSPRNVAAIRCAAEYFELTDDNLVTKAENYLNHIVTGSWRDSIAVLKSCSALAPWAEELEIVRRCSESIARKLCGVRDAPRDRWFDDVCTLSIDGFTRVIHAAAAKGLNSSLVATAVGHYAEKWLYLTKGSDMSTTLKLTTKEPEALNQSDIVTKQTQHKIRAILQGIVNLLPQDSTSLSVKFLLKILRIACLVNAGSFCKTDLAKRIGCQLEKASVDDLLMIPALGESTYDVDVVAQIVEFYIQDQSYGTSPPLSPRSPRSSVVTTSGSSISGSSVSGSSISGSSLRSLTSSSVSSSDLSGSSVTTESRSARTSVSSVSISGSDSGSSSLRSSDTGSLSISGSSSDNLFSRSGSFRSTSSETTDASSETTTITGTITTTSGSSSGLSSDESVHLEKENRKPAFYVTESPSRKALLPPTTANFKVAQLLETYVEEVAKDSSVSFGPFVKLTKLFTEFPRDSDDPIYRAIDGFLRAHPSLSDAERKSLCRLMDTGALSLAASAHAATNERLPVRVIVQLLFSEQIKLRNEMTANEVIHEKDLDQHDNKIPLSFSSATSTSSSDLSTSSDATTTTSNSSLSSGTSTSTASSSTTATLNSTTSLSSISSASALNLAVASPPRTPSVASAVSSQLLGGLSVKETLRFVLAEVESLRKSVQEMESLKSRLSAMETLQLEMDLLSSRFQEMSQDYIGMTQQVEELTRGNTSKNTKSGWSSGWKKVTKPFQSKDNNLDHHKNETPPLPPLKLTLQPLLSEHHPALRTSKSETLHPKTPRADATIVLPKTTTARADSLPVTTKTTAAKTPSKTTASTTLGMHPKTPRVNSSPVAKAPEVESRVPVAKASSPKPADWDHVKPATTLDPLMKPSRGPVTKSKEIVEQAVQITSRDSLHRGTTGSQKVVVLKSETSATTPVTTSKRQLEKDVTASETPFKSRAHRSDHHVEDAHRRPSARSRSTSPDYVRPGTSDRHYNKDSDSSVSVTSTSSYSTTSTTLSGHQYRRRGHRDGSPLDKRHHTSHGKHRHKGGSSSNRHKEHRKEHRKEHLSVDSRSKEHGGGVHSGTSHSQHSGHGHRYKEGSVGSSHHTKEDSEHHSSSHRSGHRHRRHHHPKETFSDSDASRDLAPRRRHRT